MKFKAAILVEQRKALVIDEISIVNPLSCGQALVKVITSGICGSQLGEIDGAKGEDKYLPHLLGHEACAEVVEIGPGVKKVKVGDKVVLHWRKSEGIEADAAKYQWQSKSLNAGWVTTFNQFAIISENRMTRIPNETDPTIAALMGCAVTTGFGVVENNIQPRIGESIVVYGSGGVGLNIIQAAKLKGAWPIIAVDIYKNRLCLAKDAGADITLDANDCDILHELSMLSERQSIDYFVDNTGLPDIIEMGYRLVKNNGKVVLVGVPKRGKCSNIFTLDLHFGKRIIGSHGGESIPDLDIPRYLNMVRNDKIILDQLVTMRKPLDDINIAINAMRSGELAGRVMIDM